MVEPSQHRLVEIASEMLADEAQRMRITYLGFCLTGFPHKKLADDTAWERNGHNVTLLVEPGRLKTGPGSSQLIGVPFGARARIIMTYLQTQLIRTAVESSSLVAPCVTGWAEWVSPWVGRQLERYEIKLDGSLHAASDFFWSTLDGDGRRGDGLSNGSIVRDGLFFAKRLTTRERCLTIP